MGDPAGEEYCVNGVDGEWRVGELAVGNRDTGELLSAGFTVGLNSGVIVRPRDEVLESDAAGDIPHCLSHRYFSCRSLCPRERMTSSTLSQNFVIFQGMDWYLVVPLRGVAVLIRAPSYQSCRTPKTFSLVTA